MKLIIDALLQSIPSLGNVSLILLLFWIIFGILGVQFFGGKFWQCQDSSGSLVNATIASNAEQCFNVTGASWINPTVNFDHIGNAFVALMEVATMEGWTNILQNAVNMRGSDEQPQLDSSYYAIVYFIVFIVIGAYFTLNLFISVIVDTFREIRRKLELLGKSGGALLTEGQRHYIETIEQLTKTRPKRKVILPKAKSAQFCQRVVGWHHFEAVISIVILLNLLSLCFNYYGQPASWSDALDGLNYLFTSIYTLEAIIKLIAFRSVYF